MNEKEQKYMDVTKEWMNETVEKQTFLTKDDRVDEANLEKIKYNIYDIFQKMFQRAKKIAKSEEEFIEMYLRFHQKIPNNWKSNYKHAKEEGSIDMYIEEIKLETANKVEQLFRNLWC